jgi:hypothetical protein
VHSGNGRQRGDRTDLLSVLTDLRQFQRLSTGVCAAALAFSLCQSNAQHIYRSELNLVRVDVLVTEHGQAVRGLTAKDFKVSDCGVPQQVVSATPADSVSVAVVLDTSGSVRGENLRRLTEATNALLGAMGASDNVAIVTFSDVIELRLSGKAGGETVPALLFGSPRGGGRTRMWDGLLAGASLVARGPGRSLALLLTDGLENGSWVGEKEAIECLKRTEVVVDVTGVASDGRWHELRVRTTRRGAQVQARPGYYATAPAAPRRSPTAARSTMPGTSRPGCPSTRRR